MEGVEELSDNYLMEIGENIYMKFRHAYVVGEVKEEEITLLDPHGDVEVKDEKRMLYNPALETLVKELCQHLEQLELELKASSYQGFSVKKRDEIAYSINSLDRKKKNAEKGGKGIIEELRKNWVRLSKNHKLEEINGELTGLRPKTAQNILGVLLDKSKHLKQEDIGKGFEILKRETKIKGKQEIDYKLLTSYFESIRLYKI